MTTRDRSLPIYELEHELVRSLRATPRLILEAPTGSGKSTQVPQILLENGLLARRQVVVLQPRRLAARLLARRVAAECQTRLGDLVGYQVRFENVTSPQTRIKYETDGVILRQLLGDPELSTIDTLIFDEFHERHLYGDIMLGLACRLQRTSRPDLKLIVMSATLNTPALETYLAPCPVLRSTGRQYPVEIAYLPTPPRRDEDPWETAAAAFGPASRAAGDGNVLVFMPGAYEIQRTLDALRRLPAARDFLLCPLHGDLRPEEQDAAVEPGDRRKAIVATNVAETSLTIAGVRAVIDSGYARKARFDPHRGINTLLIEKISRASADQRAGRAGRTAPGACLRLWTERDHAARPAAEQPEIMRVDLAETVLQLKQAGIEDPWSFPWLDPPETRALTRALGLLADLGALDPRTGRLTPIGARLTAFPVHPRYARMLLAAADCDCVPAIALAAALTQDRSILMPRQNRDVLERQRALAGPDAPSDLILLMRAWERAREGGYSVPACDAIGVHAGAARQIERLYRQFLDIARAEGLPTSVREPPPAALQKCILTGFSDQLARRLGPGNPRCDLVHKRRGTLDPRTIVHDGDLFVASEIHEIENARGEVDVRLSLLTAVDQAWLRELFPHDFDTQRLVGLDPVTKRVTVARAVTFRDLVIETSRGGEPTREEAARLLAAEVIKGNLVLKEWDHGVEQWIQRVNIVAQHCPDFEIPAITPEARHTLIEHICFGCCGAREVKERPVRSLVRQWLSVAQQALVERYAPTHVELSNGRKPRVIYDPGQPPHIAMRVQELFDVRDTLSIAMGRVRLAVHILAPNQRPIQITDNLATFWTESYPQVRKEWRGRYPKHEWR